MEQCSIGAAHMGSSSTSWTNPPPTLSYLIISSWVGAALSIRRAGQLLDSKQDVQENNTDEDENNVKQVFNDLRQIVPTVCQICFDMGLSCMVAMLLKWERNPQ